MSGRGGREYSPDEEQLLDHGPWWVARMLAGHPSPEVGWMASDLSPDQAQVLFTALAFTSPMFITLPRSSAVVEGIRGRWLAGMKGFQPPLSIFPLQGLGDLSTLIARREEPAVGEEIRRWMLSLGQMLAAADGVVTNDEWVGMNMVKMIFGLE